MRTSYLVCYDIADPSRLARIHRLLKGEGLHLQYSVFVCSLTWPELGRLKNRLERLIDPRADDLRLYPLPSRDAIDALGCGDRVPPGALFFHDGPPSFIQEPRELHD